MTIEKGLDGIPASGKEEKQQVKEPPFLFPIPEFNYTYKIYSQFYEKYLKVDTIQKHDSKQVIEDCEQFSKIAAYYVALREAVSEMDISAKCWVDKFGDVKSVDNIANAEMPGSFKGCLLKEIEDALQPIQGLQLDYEQCTTDLDRKAQHIDHLLRDLYNAKGVVEGYLLGKALSDTIGYLHYHIRPTWYDPKALYSKTINVSGQEIVKAVDKLKQLAEKDEKVIYVFQQGKISVVEFNFETQPPAQSPKKKRRWWLF